MYGSERNRISNVERPTSNVEVIRLSGENGITTDQQHHATTGPRTTNETRGVRKYEGTNVRVDATPPNRSSIVSEGTFVLSYSRTPSVGGAARETYGSSA